MIRLPLALLFCSLLSALCAHSASAQSAAPLSDPFVAPGIDASAPVTHVAIGNYHVCAILSDADHSVQCWGDNRYGELGTSVNVKTPLPVDAPVGPAVQLAAGDGFSCALNSADQVNCWGLNEWGQRGDNGISVPDGDATTAWLVDAREIAAGASHACALVGPAPSGGAAWCWGRNHSGQLGLGHVLYPDYQMTPGPIIGQNSFVEIAAGGDSTCARRADGRILCWGDNQFGQIGVGGLGGYVTAPLLVSQAISATAVDVGATAACAVVQEEDGRGVRCWGQLGWLSFVAFSSTIAVPIGDTLGAVEVGVSRNAACARMETGRVRCWGNNFDTGALGVGHAFAITGSVEVLGLSDVVSLAAGDQSFCAVRAHGQLYCWGDNYGGALGLGYVRQDAPLPVPDLEGVDAIDTGYYSTCARKEGTLFCWGRHTSRTEDAPFEHQITPVQGLPTGVESFSLGMETLCVVVEGSVWCRGENAFGQTGEEPNGVWPFPVPPVTLAEAPARSQGAGIRPSYTLTATRVAGLPDVVEVATSGYHTCARTQTGHIWCWGRAWDQELGDSSTENRHSPKIVPGLDNVTHLAVTFLATCAVVHAQEIWCWGNIDYTDPGGNPPTLLLTLEGVEQVEVGHSSICVRAQGRFRCWGFAALGAPLVQYADHKGATDLSRGDEHSCMVKAGDVWCWGNNSHRQVADNAPWQIWTPWRVAGVADAVEVAAGVGHTCARLASGRVLCWGDMAFGARGIDPGWLAAPVQGVGASAVHGLVRDAWGFPIPLARVAVEGRTVRVDEQGEFVLPGLAPGTHTLRAVEPSYAFEPATLTVQTPNAPFAYFIGTPSPLHRTLLPWLEHAP